MAAEILEPHSVIPVMGDAIGKGGKLAKRLGGEGAQKMLQVLQRVDVLKFLDQRDGAQP